MSNDKTSGKAFAHVVEEMGLTTQPLPGRSKSALIRESGGYSNAYWDKDVMVFGDGDSLAPVHIFTEARTLHDAVFQAEPGAVFHCGNHALVAQGQHLAGVWDKSGIEFKLVPEAWRIAEPETYADIRKD
jgi:hypothetical protein